MTRGRRTNERTNERALLACLWLGVLLVGGGQIIRRTFLQLLLPFIHLTLDMATSKGTSSDVETHRDHRKTHTLPGERVICALSDGAAAADGADEADARSVRGDPRGGRHRPRPLSEGGE